MHHRQQAEEIRQLTDELRVANDNILSLTHRLDALEGQRATNPTRAADNTPASPRVPCVVPVTNITRVSPTEFQPVRNGAKAGKKRIITPLTISNKFQILEDTEEEPHEVRMVGDSIIRGQLEEFCGRAPRNRKRFCIPGARVEDISEALEEVVQDTTNDTLVVIHAGTNDVVQTRSEELLERYRRMIWLYKTKTSNVLISGVLPRISAPSVFYSKAFSLNNRLMSLCLQEGVEFINTWNDFYQQEHLFAKDGLHLSGVGSARLGRLLDGGVRSFWTKNAQRLRGGGIGT